MQPTNDRFIELICKMRRKHVTQADIAKALGLEYNTGISNRFLGKTPWELDEAYKVLDFLGIPLSEVFTYFPPEGVENA